MIDAAERRVILAGGFNFRDLGGLATAEGRVVRRRQLFRSDALHRLTREDVDVLAALGVRTLLDLRSAREIEASGVGPLREHGVRHRHVPLIPDATGTAEGYDDRPMEELYERFLDDGPAAIRDVFAELAEDATLPAIVHCAAGKDRTSIVVALLLRVVGVPEAEVVADYALTDANMGEVVAAMRGGGRGEELDRVPPHLMRAVPETMRGFLARLDRRFGSPEHYLTGIGVDAATRDRVRALLLEDGAGGPSC